MYNCIIAFFDICYDAYKEYENTSFSLIFISIRYDLFFENLAVHLHFFISYKIILIISWRI